MQPSGVIEISNKYCESVLKLIECFVRKIDKINKKIDVPYIMENPKITISERSKHVVESKY